jgi:hypothetical protein
VVPMRVQCPCGSRAARQEARAGRTRREWVRGAGLRRASTLWPTNWNGTPETERSRTGGNTRGGSRWSVPYNAI